VSPQDKIRKLEGLLARIKGRAGAPRTNGAAEAAPAEEPVVQVAAPALVAAPPVAPSIPPASAGWSDVPPATVSEDFDGDIDAVVVSGGEMVEVDIDIDEPMPTESGAHLVADNVMEARADARALTEDVAQHAPPPAANEVEEAAPTSSPRPIETPAFEEASAPRHTPPPESGKQVAAPSVKPEPRKSTVPPPSDGHTMLGGWREPGMALPVHEASPAAPVEPLVAQVTRPALESDVPIPDFSGEAPSYTPSSFGAILEATLSI
jgi:hypothetical protein